VAAGVTLLPVEQAQARLLASAAPLATETLPLREAAGRWAAEPVHARRMQPAADLSMMDGYAVRFADMPGPWRMVGESRAGLGHARAIAPGETVRIFTGAPLPGGADAVLIQEEAERTGEWLHLAGEGPAGAGGNVRPGGSDFAKGALLIAAGALLTPARIALAAIGGHGRLPVRRRPRVGLVSTGDELVQPGEPAAGVTLPASNGAMLEAMIGARGEVHDFGIVPDRLDALADAFADAAGCDVIVTTGGASVGDHDLVRPTLERAGAVLDFWRVAMRPGKPLLAGRLGDAIVLGLPGNPVSAFVTAQLFLLPLLAHLGGADQPIAAPLRMPLDAPLPAAGPRAFYVRTQIRNGRALPLPSEDSAVLSSLAAADGLIVRRIGAGPALVDDLVDIITIA
jgi:molybdopterin molybdotransferase